MDVGRPPAGDSGEPPASSTTTISTVAVQAGKAKIVLAILRSNDWIRVRIQQMEPDLMDVGATLEDARLLRREHDELLMKLNLKQKDVTELLCRADDLSKQNQSHQDVYAAMSRSLADAWQDLNTQLEYRKMLLDQSIAFHNSANQFSVRMEEAQCKFDEAGVAPDVEAARRLLQQHTDIKKSILESSMSTLQEGQSLLDRIREMGLRADVQNRHATTAACYGIEHLLELLQDRRRRLEELWATRRHRLEQCLQLLLLDHEVAKLTEWYGSTGDLYMSKMDLGYSTTAAQDLLDIHYRFEGQAKEVHDNVLRLSRTAEQLLNDAQYLVHATAVNVDANKERLRSLDERAASFQSRMDERRQNLALAASFFNVAHQAMNKLSQIGIALCDTDLPRNSPGLAERHAQLSAMITEATTPALREGRILLERVGRTDSGVQGVVKVVTDVEGESGKLEGMCMARYEAGEKGQAYNHYQEQHTTLSSWLAQIGQATLDTRTDLGIDLFTAKDFVELHDNLMKDLKVKFAELSKLGLDAEQLMMSGNIDGAACKTRSVELTRKYEGMRTVIEGRLALGQAYVLFHQNAQQLAIEMDALEQFVQIEKLDAGAISDGAVQHKETKWRQVDGRFKEVNSNGRAFINNTHKISESDLDTRRAVAVVESVLHMFTERMNTVTDYYEHWKSHVTTGKEFKQQWQMFIYDARKTIDWVMKIEDDFFPLIAGDLGSSSHDTLHFKARLDEFLPTTKEAQTKIEEHLKMAEMLSLKGDTHGEKDQIVNELLKVHTRFQARINEYTVLLNMTSKFFTNLTQLDKLIEKTEREFSSAVLPSDVQQAKAVLGEHAAAHDHMNQLITFTHDEGEQIVVRVRQQDSETVAKDEVQKVLQLTEERRTAWERQWESHRNRLETNLQVAQFYADLKQVHAELDELSRQLDARHGNYGSSLSSVKMTSDAFKLFEEQSMVIETKVNHFVTIASRLIREQHADSRRIRTEVDQVQQKWSGFLARVSEYRGHLDESIHYFEIIDECELWFHEASQHLLGIGRAAAECKSSQEATDLIAELEKYRQAAAQSQDDKIQQMYLIIVNLYGQVVGPPKMQPTLDKNAEILDSFYKAKQELNVLRDNLVRKEQILSEMNAVVEQKAPRVPVFSQSLQNAEITETRRFTFHCRLECEGVPTIEWFKDDVPLKSPDMLAAFKDGMASLTIEETFSDDTAKYTCKATTPHGQAETSAYLKVKESHQKMAPPEFTKLLKTSEIPESTQFLFECTVAGIPPPDITWYKDDATIDASSEYVITKVNATCYLKIRKATKEHSGLYSCKATNAGGEAVSAAKLSVVGVRQPHFHEPLKNVSCAEGKSVRLEARYTGEPAPTIHWMRGDVGIIPSAVFKVIVEQDMTALEIREVYAEDAGTYSVLARNVGGDARTSCVLAVDGMFGAPPASDAEQPPAAPPAAPRFDSPLKNKDVMEGARARLDCVITAHPEPEVIWYHHEKPVKESRDFQLLFEGDRCSLIIREVYLEDSGEYKCVARNAHGSAQSQCRLVVEPLSELSDASMSGPTGPEVVPPKFTQLLKDLEGIESRQVRFDCRVIGHPAPEVKWYREHTEITSSQDFQISCQRDLHSLFVPEVFKEDAGNFMCHAVNMAGEAKCYASLAVRDASEPHVVKTRLVEEAHTLHLTPTAPGITHARPDFVTVFTDMRVTAGQQCKFQVQLRGNPRPSVRWLFNNEPIVSPDYKEAVDGDVYSLTIPEVFEEDAGRFSIIAENDSGKATCSALLEVVDESAAPPGEFPPTTASQRAQYSAPAPAPYTAPAPMIQPVAVAPVASAPPPAAGPPVTVPTFTQPLRDLSVEEGVRVVLEGAITGEPTPEVQWSRQGKPITDTPDFQLTYIDGRATLIIPEVFPEDGGFYECLATNSAGHQRSTSHLIVQAASTAKPEFIERLITREVKEGDAVRFSVRVRGAPMPHIRWYREGTEIISSPDFEIVTRGESSSLSVPEVFYEDSGKFSVVAENDAGQTTCTAELIVEAASAVEDSSSPTPPVTRSPSLGQSPERQQFRTSTVVKSVASSREQTPLFDQLARPPQPALFSQPLRDLSCRAGEPCTLECIISPLPEPQSVVWARNNIDIQPSVEIQISYSHGICSLTIMQAYPEDTGTYSCTVTITGAPIISCAMFLNVLPNEGPASPVFVAKLPDQPLELGGTAHFECKVAGNPPPEILWTRRGHPLVDKDRYESGYDQYSGVTTLTIMTLRAEDEGEYTCTAINQHGEVATSAMLVAGLQAQPAPAPPVPPPIPSEPVVYRPPTESALDAKYSDAEELPSDAECFAVSRFERGLQAEIQFRDGRLDPSDLALSDAEAFDPNTMAPKTPSFEQKVSNFKLLDQCDVSFVCKVQGVPRPAIQWFHNGRLLRPSQKYEMKYTREGYCTLRIKPAFPEDVGHYTVCATNLLGRDTCSAELFVEELDRVDDTSYVDPASLRQMMKPVRSKMSGDEAGVAEKYYKPVFRKIPPDTEVDEGTLCRFDCIVSGRPMPEIMWYREEEQVMDSGEHKIVVNENGVHSLIMEHTARDDAGLYTCVAQNRGGEDRFQVRLNVLPRAAVQQPRFIERLANVTVQEGEPLTLYAEAAGVPPPMMSWAKDGKLLDHSPRFVIQTDGTSTSLHVAQAQIDDNTWFQCNAINSAGSAANRVKITVTPRPRAKEPEKKLIIPKRGTTPVHAEARSRYATAVRESVAPRAPIQSYGQVYTSSDDDRPKSEVGARPVRRTIAPPRVSTRDLVLSESEQAPGEDDMWDEKCPAPAAFKTKPQSLFGVSEGQNAHFECRLIPVGDPSMKVDWFKDGKILRTGHRFKPVYDFGFCTLDITNVSADDSGAYMCVALNDWGQAQCQVELTCSGASAVIDDSQLPAGMTSVKLIDGLESKQRPLKKFVVEQPQHTPPVFDLGPEECYCEEGDTAKFMVKVTGFPRPKLTWWVNGAMVVSASRFKLRYDGMMHCLEIPKAREYDSGSIRVLAKNNMGEAECTTTLYVQSREDWRARLKQAPHKHDATYSEQLQASHDKLLSMRQQETTLTTQQIKLQSSSVQHMAKMAPVDAADGPRYVGGGPGSGREPPTFTKPLKATVFKEGQEARLEVQFSGGPTPEITWFHDGVQMITGEDVQIIVQTDTSFVWFSQVFAEDQGIYTVRAENMNGLAECKAMVTVIGEAQPGDVAPEFQVQMRDLSVAVGEPATFDCLVHGRPAAQVTWMKDGQPLAQNPRWKIIAEEGHYTLLVYECGRGDRGRYECQAVNACGKATCEAYLTVEGQALSPSQAHIDLSQAQAPILMEALADKTVDEGAQVVFTCRLRAVPEPVVQWYYNNQLIKRSKYFQMSSKEGLYSLTLAGAFPEDEGVYKCIARNPAGEVTSIAHLKVLGSGGDDVLDQGVVPPRYTQPMTAQDVKPGDQAIFEVVIDGTPGKVAWYCQGVQLQPSNNVIIEQRDQKYILVVKVCGPEHVGLYTCRVTNAAGVAETSAVLYIEETRMEKIVDGQVERPPFCMPKVVKAPLPDANIWSAGETAKLEVRLECEPEPIITWYHKEQIIETSTRIRQTYDHNTHIVTLLIFDARPEDSGEYTLLAQNDFGDCTWKTTLNIEPTQRTLELVGRADSATQASAPKAQAPRFVVPLLPETTVNESSTARMEVHMSGNPTPSVLWLVNGAEIRPSPKYSIQHDGDRSVLLIRNIVRDDTAVYTVKAVNECGEAVSTSTLYVIPTEKRGGLEPPRFVLPLQSCEAFDGEEVVLTCSVRGMPRPNISWFHNKKCIDASEDFVLTYNRDTGKCDCVIVECLPDDQGVFRCVASNEAGEANTEGVLVWKPTPVQPEASAPISRGAVVSVTSGPPAEMGKKEPKIVKRQEFVVEGENRLDTETVTTMVTHNVKKVVKKCSGEPPKFTRPIQPQVVKAGEIATFTASFCGAPTPTVMWLKDKVEVYPSDRIQMLYDADSAMCQLIIRKSLEADQGVYSCRAMNELGRATCTANCVVIPPGAEVTGTQKTMSVKKEKVTTMGGEETRVTEMSPQFLQPLFPSINAVEGQTVTMECLADGAPLPQIMWTHAARVLEPSRRHELHFKNNVATLVIHSVNAMDSGDYVCRAFNDLGEITTKCVLRVGDAGRGGVQIPLATGGPGRPGMPPSGSRPGSLPAQHTTPAPQGAEGVVMNLGPGQVPHMQLGQSATFQLGGPQQMMTTHQQQMTQQMVSPGEIIIEGGSSTMQTHEMYEQMTSYQTQGTPMEASSYQTQQIVGGPSQQTQQVSSSMSNLQQQKHMIQQHIQSQSPVPMARSPQPAGRGRTMTTMRQQYSGKSGRTSPPGETFHASLERPKQTVPLRRGGHSTPPTMSPQMQHRTFQRIEMMTSRSESRSPVRSRQITPVRGGISSPLPPRSDRSTPQPEAPRFTLPLRDLTVNDGDKASFKVCFRGHPPSKVSWFFNSEMIIHSQDFHITIDIQRGECTLIIKEVFPDDEGEYMCKAENSLGAAVTVCHLFVRLPSSSEEDLVSATSTSSMMAQQHMTSVTTKDMLLQAPMQVRERSSFSETISIDTQKRYKEFQMQFQLPERKSERSEIMARQDAALRGMRMDVDVQLPTPRTHTETKTMMLNKQIDVKSQAQSKHLAYLNMDLGEQRRFSETVAIDRARSQPVQLEFTLPEQRRRLEKSAIQIRQQAALRGMKMEVEVPEQRTVSQATHMAKKRAEAIGTKRQEVFLELGGEPPHFSRDLASAKVMDGEEVKFSAKVTGNPMPEVTWYKNNKVIVENPDFHMTYDRKTGETTLHIVEVFPQDTGEFRCIAVNQYGRAVTGATLQVDVFEYVADSEEASASAAESHDGRLMSEDEVEFLERTQAFIANMQKLRQELQEEQVNEESIEMSERYDEETVQMAEVNWQIPSRGTEHVMRPEDEILHLAQPMDAVPDEGLAQEQRVRVNLAQPAKKPRLTAQAHEQMERMQIEQGAEFQADYQVQKTEGEAVTAERDQAYLTHAEGALAAPVTEVVTPEQGADLGAEYDEMQSHEERVRVDMQVPDVVDAKPSQIQHTREMVTPEMAKADIVEFPENLVEGDNVNVSLESGHLKSRPLQLAGPMAEKVMPELVVAQIDDSIKEARLIPGVVMPEYEPAMLEWYRLEIRVAPGCIQPLYPDDEVDMTQTQLTLTDMKAQYEEDQRILQEAQVNQQLAQVMANVKKLPGTYELKQILPLL